MARRANGAGTLYRRNGWFYAQIKVGESVMRKALDTRDKRKAVRRLDALAAGFDLGDEERLAALAVRLKPKTARRSFDEAWAAYIAAPENVAQSVRARGEDTSIWKSFRAFMERQSVAYLLDDVTENLASDYFRSINARLTPSTVNRHLRILNRIWRINRVEPNPWSSFRRLTVVPVQRRALSKAEVDLLISKADGELRTLFILGVYTGLRLGDCQRFRWESVTGDRIMVRTSKTKRIAALPIHPLLKEAMGEPKKEGYLLPELAAMPIWSLTYRVQRLFAACGFETLQKRANGLRSGVVVGFHSLRSTFITRLGEAGVPLAVVREMVGHVSEEMSQRYFRADDDMAAKAIAALG
jgi:integrase